MRRIPLVLVLGALLPAAAHAQSPAVAALRTQWRTVSANLTRAADELSEADYAYRPVATVRTFGQLFAHVAGAQLSRCASALGESARDEDAVEKGSTTKAAIVAALRQSNELCTRAYAQTDAAAAAATQLYGQSRPRLDALAMNAVHDGEHYGNVVTYMRMKGLVPPSSRQ